MARCWCTPIGAHRMEVTNDDASVGSIAWSRPSMSRRGNRWDNAVAESFTDLIKKSYRRSGHVGLALALIGNGSHPPIQVRCVDT